MVGLSDILALLDRWPTWKAVKEAPARIEALEKRLAALEAKSRPGDQSCPSCGGAMAFAGQKAHPIFGEIGGLKLRTHRCEGCGFEQETEWDPAKRA